MAFPVIIVDDEKKGAESLSMLISEYCPDLLVRALAYSIEDAVRAIKQLKPLIVFLDIEMPVGNGFEIVNKTSDQHYEIIFTTAHRQYALEALKVQAVDYLLKPIDINELVIAVNKTVLRLNSTEKPDLQALQIINGKNTVLQRKLSVPGNDGFIVLDMDSIMRAEADSNYTHLFCSDKNKITATRTLKEFEALLDPDMFFRTHQSHIININKVERYVKGDGGYVILNDGTSIPISRSKKVTFLALFSRE